MSTFPVLSHSLALSSALLLTPCHVVRCSMERPTWQGTKGGFEPINYKELRSQSNSLEELNPANKSLNELREKSFPVEP